MGNAGNLLWIVGGVAGAAIGVVLWLLIGMTIFGFIGFTDLERVIGFVGFALLAGVVGAGLAAEKR